MGKSIDQAREALAADHFRLVVAHGVKSTAVKSGSVVSQDPATGTSLKQGDVVTVVPSSGLPVVTVPDLKGNTCTGAEKLLVRAGLKYLCPALLAYTDTVPKTQVINWSYSGSSSLDPTKALWGGEIKIAISEGRAPVMVPYFTGATFTGYAGELRGLGFVVRETQTYNTTAPVGAVIGATPAPGSTLFIGSTVTVTVSKGPHIVTVPNLSHDTVAAATAALKAVTLTVGATYGPPTGKVFTTVPLAGAQVKAGSSVTLYTQ